MAASQADASQLQAAVQRAEAAEASAASVQASQSAAEQETERLRGTLDAKASELQSLETAMGELAYEAESARTAKLRCQQLQVRWSAAASWGPRTGVGFVQHAVHMASAPIELPAQVCLHNVPVCTPIRVHTARS